MKMSDSPLQIALRFLSHHIRELITYMGIRAVVTLAAVLALSAMLVLGRLVSYEWFFCMLPIPALVYGCAGPALRSREWRLVSLFLYETPKALPRRNRIFQPWWPAALDFLAADFETPLSSEKRRRLVRNWRIKRMGLELLTLLPFVAVGVVLAWQAPWPIIAYVMMTALVVGWGFAAGSLAPVFVLMLVVRAFPGVCRKEFNH
ncbi:MAG TPA: hypothetical protein ENN40_10360 [Candidatus Aminicenantes bacterium]|nr:hypothetical protein [Candidatus Aminicenantes bacterium]